MAEHKIIPSPHKGINLSLKEQYLSPEMRYAADIVNMLSTKQSTLRKRAGYRYFDTVPEGAVPLDIFEFGAITDDGLVPVVLWVGHQKVEIISALVLFPDSFTATPGSAQVLLSWDEVEDASYELEYKLTTATDWTDVTGISGLSHTVESLTNDSEYQFRIRSVIDGVNSKWKTIAATPSGFTAAPEAPTNLRETIEQTSFTPMWDPSNQALDYELRYREVGTTPYTTVSNIMGTSHEITGLNPATDYEWQVRARNTFNTESFSARVPATARQVTTLAGNWFVASSEAVTITLGDWTDRTSGDLLQWLLTSGGQTGPTIPAAAMDGNTAGELTLFRVRATLAGFSQILITGGDLLPAIETGVEALRIDIGSSSLTLPGPGYSGNENVDASQPYNFAYSQTVRAQIAAFITAVGSASQTERDAATLTFLLGTGEIYKSTDQGSNWDSGTDTPANPQGFTVNAVGLWALLGNDMIYEKGAGAWGQPQGGPEGVTGLTGIDKDEDGNLFVVSNATDRFYERVGITWNTGTPVASWMTDPQGISEDDGNVYVLDAGTGKYGTYADGSWDNGTDLPAAATSPTGINVLNGIVYVVDDATDKVYKRESGSWDSGTAIASGATNPAGFAISGVSLT